MKRKRLLIILMTLVCLCSSLVPMSGAYASLVSDAVEMNRYSGLANKELWLQVADYCLPTSYGDNIIYANMYYTDEEKSNRNQVLDFLNLNFEYNNVPMLYSSFLEPSKDDGKIYCKELGNILPYVLDLFGKYTEEEVSKIWCDSSLFNIYVGYNRRDSYISIGDLKHSDEFEFPSYYGDWTKPSGTTSSKLDSETCHANINNIRSALMSDKSYNIFEDKDGNEYFFIIGIEIQRDKFKLSDWLSEEVGDLASVKDELLYGIQRITFDSVCRKTELTQEDYNKSKNGGVNGDLVFEIFDTDKNGLYEYKYVQLNDKDANKKIYASDNISSSTSTTCGELAEALSANSSVAKKILQLEGLHNIVDCYNSAQQNIDYFNEVLTKLNRIQGLADGLIKESKEVLSSKEYSGTRFFVNRSQAAKTLNTQIGDGIAVNAYIEQMNYLENVARDFNNKLTDNSFSESDEEILNEAILALENSYNTFQSEVIDEVEKVISEIPDINTNSSTIRDQGGRGSIKKEVENFYTTNESGEFICTITSSVLLQIKEKIESIIGGSISFTDFNPRDKTEEDVATVKHEDTECYANSGPIGWLICPIIQGVSGIGEKMWANIESNFLQTPIQIFEDDGMQFAWGAIRNIGNIVFIILFLIVIFSQLTECFLHETT